MGFQGQKHGKFRGNDCQQMAVGYLDLLGTSAKVIETGIASVLETYERLYISYKGSRAWYSATGPRPDPLLKIFTFSDSVLFVAPIETVLDVTTAVAVIAGVVSDMLCIHAPVRGAVVFGEFCLNESLNFHVGLPLVQAARIEGEMETLGLSLLMPEGALTPLMKDLSELHWLSEQPVPLKLDAEIRLRHAKVEVSRLRMVRWFLDDQDTLKQLNESLTKLQVLRKNTPESHRHLIENAIKFLLYEQEKEKVTSR
jgi:hypothetical protein